MNLTNTDSSFSPQALARVLADRLGITPDTPLKIAFSGGLDSHVLLHALCALRDPLRSGITAVHIDHGLQKNSSAWAQHCVQVCAGLGVSCLVERVDVRKIHEEGLEAAARRARYTRLARHVGAGEVILTAHHVDDQAETVLLQLLRGAGVQGLAAMPVLVEFSAGHLARPLLEFTRHELETYAKAHGLRWIEDTSNQDTRLARNFLRHRIFPLVGERWPGAARQLARSARHAAEAAGLLDELAATDILSCRASSGTALSVAALRRLPPPRRRNLIRYWLRAQGLQAPSTMHLDQIMALTENEPRSRHALIRWPGTDVHRFHDELVAFPARGPLDTALCLSWDPLMSLEIPGSGLRLRSEPVVGAGLSRERIGNTRLTVRLRQGGETCQLAGRRHHHKLKKLLQEAGIPPWERERLPLVYADDELAAIGDRWVCEPYAAHTDEPSWKLVLEYAEKFRGSARSDF